MVLENEPKYVDANKLTDFNIHASRARSSILEYTYIFRWKRNGLVTPGEEQETGEEADGNNTMEDQGEVEPRLREASLHIEDVAMSNSHSQTSSSMRHDGKREFQVKPPQSDKTEQQFGRGEDRGILTDFDPTDPGATTQNNSQNGPQPQRRGAYSSPYLAAPPAGSDGQQSPDGVQDDGVHQASLTGGTMSSSTTTHQYNNHDQGQYDFDRWAETQTFNLLHPFYVPEMLDPSSNASMADLLQGQVPSPFDLEYFEWNDNGVGATSAAGEEAAAAAAVQFGPATGLGSLSSSTGIGFPYMD